MWAAEKPLKTLGSRHVKAKSLAKAAGPFGATWTHHTMLNVSSDAETAREQRLRHKAHSAHDRHAEDAGRAGRSVFLWKRIFVRGPLETLTGNERICEGSVWAFSFRIRLHLALSWRISNSSFSDGPAGQLEARIPQTETEPLGIEAGARSH